MDLPSATIVIVNYNSGERLQRCLACLAGQSRTDFEVVVVDNDSTDGSGEAARSGSARLIEAGANLGFAAANNRAAAGSRAEWLVFLNPDAYAAPDWFERLMEAAANYPFADAFGSTQVDANHPDRLDGAGDVFHALGIPYRGGFGWNVATVPPDGECFAPCAAAAMYRRTRFMEVGGFDESFFCYGEDVDLGFRLRLAGGRIIQLRNARVLHEGSAISGRLSDFTVYHGHRNRIWLTYKNMPALLYWPLAPARLLADLYLYTRLRRVGSGNAYLRAMRDGYGALPRLGATRRSIQRSRKIGTAALASMLTWSPARLLRRQADVRPLTPPVP